VYASDSCIVTFEKVDIILFMKKVPPLRALFLSYFES